MKKYSDILIAPISAIGFGIMFLIIGFMSGDNLFFLLGLIPIAVIIVGYVLYKLFIQDKKVFWENKKWYIFLTKERGIVFIIAVLILFIILKIALRVLQ